MALFTCKMDMVYIVYATRIQSYDAIFVVTILRKETKPDSGYEPFMDHNYPTPICYMLKYKCRTLFQKEYWESPYG